MSAGGLFTLYSYHTLYVVETVCKQFINGSVPFGYSLNSGFDTGNDSWLSSGSSLAGGHTCSENACRYTGTPWGVGCEGNPSGDKCYLLFFSLQWDWLLRDQKTKAFFF